MPFLWLVRAGRQRLLLALVWAILFLALLQVAGWSGGPNLTPLAPIILLGLILRVQPRGLSASASETEPLPRGGRLG